jgi:hypothetical protein
MKTFLSIFACFSFLFFKAQVAVSYFPFQSILALSTNTEKLLWGDFKLETNTFFTNMNMEFSPKCHIKRSETVNYYIGAGLSINPVYIAADLSPLNGFFADIGVRIKPLKTQPNVQLVFEISPYVNALLSGGNFRTRLGLAYNFGKHISK